MSVFWKQAHQFILISEEHYFPLQYHSFVVPLQQHRNTILEAI
jgi:hypothetical protein